MSPRSSREPDRERDPDSSEPTGNGDQAADERDERDHRFLGHPLGLLTLSGLEVWERFSFLGMQAILVLFFSASEADNGLGMTPGAAASVAAGYSTLVYLLSVAGGWIADRMLGSYRSVLYGGVLIACGHYAMAVPVDALTWIGLGLISAGTGMLKPNVAAMVGKLYSATDERRDAGFSLYYMSINVGAFFGPIVTGLLGEDIDWHWGFSAAAVGMTLGLIQYVAGRRRLAGRKESAEFALPPAAMRRATWLIVAGVLVCAALCVALSLAGALTLSGFVDALTYASMAAPLVYFTVIWRSPRVSAAERGRLRPFLVLWLASVAFNFVLFQSYTVLVLLTDAHVNTSVFGYHVPSSWISSALGAVSVLSAPFIAGTWQRMGPRQPHASNKLALGVLLGGLGFFVLVPPLLGASGDGWRLSLVWIVLAVLFIGVGDVLLESTGLSATSKLAPAAFSSQALALWFLSLALATGVQAQTVKFYGEISDSLYFTLNGAVAVVVALAVFAVAPWLRRTMHPVH
ncbi:oligopeptide:H+ symporter [Streptomyces sp. NBC_01775]|uniref:peptide MFS transporter n=1 Tax=Streptomyces sp. NBC_01775 TaxID=2975939 RepID=UPI002DD86B2A|nr:oligopeptide:H+ symporter [Streptomyces sp. NBC_01775]WSB77416.1 oligopeptide:H+ symporter [Streptomyces sp. NBC_01775]